MNFFLILSTILSNGLIDYCYTSGVDTGLMHLRKQISKNTKKEFGRKFLNLDMDIINSYINVSFDECIWKCHKKSRCRAIEYRRKANYCALVWKYGEIETQPGSYIAHDFVNTDQKQCGDKTCNRKQTCEYSEEESHCTTEECRNPVAGQKLKGNIYTVGSKIISCYGFGMVKFVCSTSGEWWTTAGPQEVVTCAELGRARLNVSPSRTSIITNKLGMTLRCDQRKENDVAQVMLRRFGYLDFYRDWEDYKYGFGHVCGDFWAGLENIYKIMEISTYEFALIISMKDWNGNVKSPYYTDFRIASENQMYQLSFKGFYGQTVGNALEISNGMPFATYDRTNHSCVRQLKGAWWYNECNGANLNGKYYWKGELTEEEAGTGVTWYTWHGYNYSLKGAVMRMHYGLP